jgi:hypothetical protein
MVQSKCVYNKNKRMKKPMKKIIGIIIAASFIAATGMFFDTTAHATHTRCEDGRPIPHSNARQAEAFCSGTVSDEEAAVAAEDKAQAHTTCDEINVTASSCPILSDYVIPAINALSAAVGVVVVIMVVWGGIQYTSSKDNPQQAAQAKEHIRNALLALVIYIFIVAFLNWVVPGGIF